MKYNLKSFIIIIANIVYMILIIFLQNEKKL